MTPERVVLVGANLLVGSRVEAVARAAGRTFSSARDTADLEHRLTGGEPAFVLIDLSAPGVDLGGVVDAARRHRARMVVAFGPHKDVESRARALAAGCDRWLPNSKLAAELPKLLADGNKPC